LKRCVSSRSCRGVFRSQKLSECHSPLCSSQFFSHSQSGLFRKEMKDIKYAWGPGRLHEPGFLMSEFLETNPMIGPCEPFGGKTDKTSAHDIVKNCVARKFEYLLHFQKEHRDCCLLVQRGLYIHWAN
jgi:hypothetical protein